MADYHTVNSLLRELQDFVEHGHGDELVVMNIPPRARPGEYVPITVVQTGHLRDQNTDGDPELHWTSPAEIASDPDFFGDYPRNDGGHDGKVVLVGRG